MNYEETLEEIEKLLERLRSENSDVPVIVEGEKDSAALRNLGLDGTILTLNSGMSLFNFCERIAASHKSVIVLTDWDSRGGTLCRRIREGLEANSVRPNLEFRRKIAVLCKKDVKDVEGLPNYILTLERWTKTMRREGAHKRMKQSMERARAKRRA